MKTSPTLLALTLAITSGALCQASEEKIRIDEAPAAVQKAIKERAGSNLIIKIERASEHGQTRYEALTQKADGRKIAFILKVDGALDSTEETLALSETPKQVAEAVNTTVKGAPIHAVERVTKDGIITYEVSYRSGDGAREAVFSSEGKLLKDGPEVD